jgi:hypothetical protein
MKRYSLFTRGPFVAILLAAGFLRAWAEDSERLAVDFSQKVGLSQRPSQPLGYSPGAAFERRPTS